MLKALGYLGGHGQATWRIKQEWLDEFEQKHSNG
jgi:hypothetical protein